MKNYIVQQLISFGIGLVLGWLGHVLTSRREARNRVKKAKDDFGVFIRERIAELTQHGVREFYDTTKPAIRDAVCRLWHYLEPDARDRLDRCWKEYDEVPAIEFDPKRAGVKGELMRALCHIAKPPAEFQTPYEIERYYLDQFYRFSS